MQFKGLPTVTKYSIFHFSALYRRVLNNQCDQNEDEMDPTSRRSKSGAKEVRFLSHEIRAGDVLQLRLQADLRDLDFAAKVNQDDHDEIGSKGEGASKTQHYLTDCSVSKSHLKGGNR